MSTEKKDTSWSAADLSILHTHYPVSGADKVAELTGRGRAAVLSKAKRLKIPSGKPPGQPRWTEQEDAQLKVDWPAGRSTQELVRDFGRNPAAIHARACLLGLKRPPRVAVEKAPKPAKVVVPPAAPAKEKRSSGYTAAQEQRIREQFPHVETAALAAEIGKSEDAVRHFATRALGLVKTPAFLAAREAQLAEQRLVKKKAKAQAEKKAQKKSSVGPAKWWHFPMSSAEYKAGLAATTAGKKPTTIIDSYGRPATVWRNAA